MNEYLPLLIMGAVIGVISIAFVIVYKTFGKINPEDDFERIKKELYNFFDEEYCKED